MLPGRRGKRTNSSFISARKKLDTVGAADYLGLGKSTLDKLRVGGGGPAFIKIGKRVVYDPADLSTGAPALPRTPLLPQRSPGLWTAPRQKQARRENRAGRKRPDHGLV